MHLQMDAQRRESLPEKRDKEMNVSVGKEGTYIFNYVCKYTRRSSQKAPWDPKFFIPYS